MWSRLLLWNCLRLGSLQEVDIPDAEGEPHTHAGILQNPRRTVKPAGLQAAMSVTLYVIEEVFLRGLELTLPFPKVRHHEFLGAYVVGQSFHHFC